MTKDHAGATNQRQPVSSPIPATVRPASPTDSSPVADPLDPATASPFDSALTFAFHHPLELDQ